MAVMVRATTGRVGDAGRVGDPEAEVDKTTAAFEWVYPLPSRASELVVIFFGERERSRAVEPRQGTHAQPPAVPSREKCTITFFVCLR